VNVIESDFIQKVAIAFQVNPDLYEIKEGVEEEGISGNRHKIDFLMIPKEKGSKIALMRLGDRDFSSEVMVFNSKTEDLNIPFKGILVERDLDERERKLLEIYNIKAVDIRKQASYSTDGSGSLQGNPIFGVEAIDNRIGNSIKKGNLYMVAGKTGVGKTTTCLHFLVNGAKKGEKGAIILTDTRPTEFISNSSSFSFGFEAYYKARMIEILEFSDQIREMKYEILSNRKEEKKFITKITTEIRKFVVGNNISRLVIDPITPALVGEDDFINIMMNALAIPGVITLVTSNVRATDVSFFGIEEYYCSGVIKLEFADATYGTRTMSTIKMRGGSYDPTPFNYRITNDGIVPAEEIPVSPSPTGSPILKPFRDVM
jgi:circadian clock protein KaiC